MLENLCSNTVQPGSIKPVLVGHRLTGKSLLACWLWAAASAMAQTPAQPTNALSLPEHLTIIEFLDFECPVSAAVAPELKALVENYPGNAQVIFKNLPLASHPHAPLAHAAALAAKRQGKFEEMSDLLFHHQDKLERPDLIGYARSLNLNLRKFKADIDGPEIKAAIAEDVCEAAGLAATRTPTFFINGQKLVGADWVPEFRRTVEQIRSGVPLPTLPISTENSPTRGPKDAPVTIVEFSDLQCPFCARGSSVLRDLMAEYPGQIQLIFKNFPLNIHPKAQLAHRAALAAAQQGKFWEMHDVLFANQQKVNPDFVRKTALELALDLARFDKDQNDPQLQAIIDRDQKEGARLGVNGTPSFLINGKLLVGAQPKETFETILNSSLHLTAVPRRGAAEPETPERSPEPVQMVWYSDLESPLTPRAYELVREAEKAYPGKIQVTIKHAPLTFHNEGLLAHEALLAAGAQGKFWPMHDLLLAIKARSGMTIWSGTHPKSGWTSRGFERHWMPRLTRR